MNAHEIAMISALVPGWTIPEQEFLLEDRLTYWKFASRYYDAYVAAISYGFPI